MKKRASKILIVDDYHSNRVSLERLLKPIDNIQIFHAESGNQALSLIIHHQFSLILLDVNMPEMDGYEVAELITSTESHKHTPIIMLTAHTGNQSALKAYDSGAVDYLTKPIEPTILLNKVGLYVTLDQLQNRTERLKAEKDAIIESIGQGLIKVSQEGIIEFANAAALSLLNQTATEVLSTQFNKWFTQTNCTENLFTKIQTQIEANSVLQQKVTLKPFNKDVHKIEITCSRKQTDQDDDVIILFQDITQKQAYEAELTHLANFDSLTKLANRNHFNQHLNKVLLDTQDKESNFFLLMLGLDGFKKINDTLGHSIGDKLLVGVASRITESLPSNAFAARLGGDEFAILIQHPEIHAAENLAKQLVQLISNSFIIQDHEIYIETSIGIADAKTGHYDKSVLLKSVDIALNEAKLAGKNRFKLFISEMAEQRSLQASIQNKLRHLLESRALVVHYQPQFSVNLGEFVGFEALARWPEQGYGEQISPGVFVPIAEQSILIQEVGKQVLIQACDQLALWHQENKNKHLTISVNLSAKQLNHPLFLEELKDILLKYHFPLERLIFEITETAILSNSESIITSIHNLKAMGVRLALDDFGTGYSSLNYLQKLPFDAIKIDQCFVRRLGSCKKTEALVKAIITIADACNMDVIAEGVESTMHHQQVVALGCNKIQGYYYSPALPIHQLDEYCVQATQLQ
ncbi:EAL domain-containing protein [Marinomonas sp. PE14-40]|uniref:EAL domain-containing protein n=1 Tax=Marinomonas sp. PE14-40 TaxID=3060621 RepID=UPI003F67881A